MKSNVEMDISLKSDIYPKWWGEKKIKMSLIKKNKMNNLENSIDSKKHNRNLKKSTSEISQNEISLQEDSYHIHTKKQKNREKTNSANAKPISSVEKRFNKKKPNQVNTTNINAYQNLSRNNEESSNLRVFCVAFFYIVDTVIL